MRQLGTIRQDADAARFAAYLLTQSISAQVEKEDDSWSVWVRDEDQVEAARTELNRFLEDPQADRYHGVERTAAELQQKENARLQQAEKNMVQVRSQWRRGAVERMPLTMVLIIISVLVTFLTNFGSDPSWATRVSFANPQDVPPAGDYLANTASILKGEVWRLVTPIFMHLDSLHILFNMIWLYVLGGQIERLRGTSPYCLIVLVAAIVSNTLQATAPYEYGGTYAFGGMSGVIYALFGYVWVKSRLEPEKGFMISDFNVIFLLGWLVLCMSGAFARVANVAHVTGLIAGILYAYVPIALWPGKK